MDDKKALLACDTDSVEDPILWVGKPSQWINVPTLIAYTMIVLLAAFTRWAISDSQYAWRYSDAMIYLDYVIYVLVIILLVKLVYKYLIVFCTRYELTKERLIEFTGVTSLLQNGEPLELYNIYDYQFPPPFFLAFFRRGDLILLTHDASQPIVNLQAIKDRREVYEAIRGLSEELRLKKKAYFNDLA